MLLYCYNLRRSEIVQELTTKTKRPLSFSAEIWGSSKTIKLDEVEEELKIIEANNNWTILTGKLLPNCCKACFSATGIIKLSGKPCNLAHSCGVKPLIASFTK